MTETNQNKENGAQTSDESPKTPLSLKISFFAFGVSILALVISYLQYDIAKDTTKRQLRSYIVADSIALKKPLTIGQQISMELFVYNMGQTPAYNLRQSCIFLIDQHPRQYSSDEFEKDNSSGIMILGSGKPKPISNISTIDAVKGVRDIIEQRSKLFYYALVRYDDIFNQSHALRVCAEYLVESKSFRTMPDCNYEE